LIVAQQPWSIIFYTTESSKSPVEEFLSKLPNIAEARMAKGIALLAGAGFRLGPPWIKKIDDELWELRAVGGEMNLRILFCREGHEFILLHAIKKKQQKLPRRDIEIAHERRKEYKERFG